MTTVPDHAIGTARRARAGLAPGLRGRLLVALLVVLLVPLGIVASLSLASIQGLGGTSVNGLEEMGDGAVGSSDKALNALGREKLAAVAAETATRTGALLDRIDSDLRRLAGELPPDCPRSGAPEAVELLVNETASTSPRYRYLDAEGRPDGRMLPLVSNFAYFCPDGTLEAAAGETDLSGSLGLSFASQRYWALGKPALDGGAASYRYDPFADNGSAGNAYWEPGTKAEDMVVLPHRALSPFGPVLPGNLPALQAATPATQHGTGAIKPDRGNMDPRQLGLLELAPVRGPGGQIAGVVAAHVTLPAMMQAVREVQEAERAEGKSGYAYLFNRQGVLLAHSNPQHVGGDSSWHPWIVSMLPNTSGFLDYSFRGARRFVAYQTVPSSSWKVAATALADDFLKPAQETAGHIDTITNTTRQNVRAESESTATSFIAAAIVVLLVAAVAGLAMGNRVVRPVVRLTALAESIRRGDLRTEYTIEGEDDVALLAQAFSNVLTTLRMGNVGYFQGDLRKALEAYRRGLVLFESSSNEKGIGMCCNNIGNIYRRWGETDEALANYQRAIDIARKLDDRKALAARYGNMGILMKALGRPDEALQWYTSALAMDRAGGDQLGEAIRLNNLGIVLRDRGRFDLAGQYFSAALSINNAKRNARGIAATLNDLGQLALATNEDDRARTYLESARDVTAKLRDTRGEAQATKGLAALEDRLGNSDAALKLQARARELEAELVPTKNVLLVIDKSGSMDGPKILAAKEGARNLLDRKVGDRDLVGIMAFDDQIDTVLPMVPKRGNEKRIDTAIGDIIVEGQTALFDAIGTGLEVIAQARRGDRLWLVALTDGEDNASRRYTTRMVGGRRRKPLEDLVKELGLDVTLIVMGVEVESQREVLTALCQGCGFGRYIAVEETADAGIDGAIREAYGKVEAMFDEQESVEEYEPEK